MTDPLTEREMKVEQVPAVMGSAPAPLSADLVKQIAMDIGKEVAAHLEVMYPKAVEATSKTMLLSVRNSVYNEIMAALTTTDETEILARLADRKKFRRRWKAAYRKIRRQDEPAPGDDPEDI